MKPDSDYTLFLDLDGVLVDFDRGVLELTGKLPSQLEPRSMWPRIAGSDSFYENLHWMQDGKALWNFAQKYGPVILTGLPMGKWAEPQKRAWCARELGINVEVITCMSRHKAVRARERSGDRVPVLVDDRLKLRESWTGMGGIFIHHVDAETSIAALREILPPQGS